MRAKSEFRPEIEGLRAVAVLLVRSYHIWSGSVSGGVDVFFVVSGYLVTDSIVRQAERDGYVHFTAFWARAAVSRSILRSLARSENVSPWRVSSTCMAAPRTVPA
jgi:hypothetical protein